MKYIAELARKLKGSDLQDYMEAKGITFQCPSCGNDQVSIISHGADDPLHILAMPRVHPEEMAGDSLEMVGLACRNCGNMRMFAARDVVEWKEQEPSHVE